MASRREQKEQARAARLEKERESQAAATQRRRLQVIAGVVTTAVIVVVVAIVVSSSGGSPGTPAAPADKAAVQRVKALLAGIPQSTGNVLGKPNAPVTITEYGDLECSACDEFDIGSGVTSPGGVPGSGILESLIKDEVATGKAKLVYKSLDTATGNGVTPDMWTTQQAAANAAGLQGKGWSYVELFYNEQGAEGTSYVTMSYLEGLAKQVPGLNYAKWLKALNSNASVRSQVAAQNAQGTQLDQDDATTPTISVKGPKLDARFEGIKYQTPVEITKIEAAVSSAA